MMAIIGMMMAVVLVAMLRIGMIVQGFWGIYRSAGNLSRLSVVIMSSNLQDNNATMGINPDAKVATSRNPGTVFQFLAVHRIATPTSIRNINTNTKTKVKIKINMNININTNIAETVTLIPKSPKNATMETLRMATAATISAKWRMTGSAHHM